MVTQAPEAALFIPPTALPPKTMISPRLEAVATSLGEAIHQPDRGADTLAVLRLLCPFGDPTGLALPAPEQPAPLVCSLAAQCARQANRLDVLPFLDTLGARLQSDALRQTFPELFQRPRPNANVLWSTHAQLASVQAYPLLAVDLQFGLIAALARTGWTWTVAAAKSMDAMITAALRIIPRLDAEAITEALASYDPFACGRVIRQTAIDLTYLRHPNRPLPRATQLGYARDCCRLLNHPEWVSTEMGDAPLGASNGLARTQRHRGWQFDDDDPPETEAAPDRFRERYLEKIERQVRRQVTPGAGLDEFDADADLGVSGLLIYGEELAVLREYPHPLAWHAVHPNDLAALVGMVFRDKAPSGSFAITKLSMEKLMLRTALLTMCLTGRSLDWLLRVRIGDWPNSAECLPSRSMPPRYVPECDAIVYWPEAIPDLPTQPEQTADLFEPVSPVWVLPLPDPLIPWWHELANRCAKGECALALTTDQFENALKSATGVLREKTPNMPALTQGRLRAAYTALMEHDGRLDPLLAACISGQWRNSLRVPLFYTTLSLHLLGDRYRDAVRRVWVALCQLHPHLPEAFRLTPAALPELRMGSPYYPKRVVVRQAVQTLYNAVVQAIQDEGRHNAKTLLALYGLSLLMGLRISEAASLRTMDFDLRAIWQGEAMPWVVLPETKGNRWTSAARIVPLPECLLPLLQKLLPDDLQAPAFSFRTQGRLVSADKGEIRRQLAELDVPFPRWHAGRHLLRTFLLEQGMPFDATNAILGHQSAGRELFNPYLPGNPGVAWRAFRGLSDKLAQELGWPVGCQ